MTHELARAILVDHSRSKRNGLFPENYTYSSKLTNPLCGDHVELKLYSVDGVIKEAGFKSHACAICTASASLLCQEIKDLSLTAAKALSDDFESTLLTPSTAPWPQSLKSFHCFEHLRINPARKTCALLPWITLRSALRATTEGNQ